MAGGDDGIFSSLASKLADEEGEGEGEEEEEENPFNPFNPFATGGAAGDEAEGGEGGEGGGGGGGGEAEGGGVWNPFLFSSGKRMDASESVNLAVKMDDFVKCSKSNIKMR